MDQLLLLNDLLNTGWTYLLYFVDSSLYKYFVKSNALDSCEFYSSLILMSLYSLESIFILNFLPYLALRVGCLLVGLGVFLGSLILKFWPFLLGFPIYYLLNFLLRVELELLAR